MSQPQFTDLETFCQQGLANVALSSLSDDDRVCTICYENYPDSSETPYGNGPLLQPYRQGQTTKQHPDRPLRILACGHVFGSLCLHKHVRTGYANCRSCPMCRGQLYGADRTPAIMDQLLTYEALDFDMQDAMATLHYARLLYRNHLENIQQDQASGALALTARQTMYGALHDIRLMRGMMEETRGRIRERVRQNGHEANFQRVLESVRQGYMDFISCWELYMPGFHRMHDLAELD